jgi:hypothetical protein
MPAAVFSAAQYRRFGWLAAALLVFAAWRVGGVPAVALGALAVLLSVLALVRPTALRRPHALLMTLTWPIGWLVSRTLLTLVYAGLIAPLGLLFRLIGRDALYCRPDPEAATYWEPCAAGEVGALHQF